MYLFIADYAMPALWIKGGSAFYWCSEYWSKPWSMFLELKFQTPGGSADYRWQYLRYQYLSDPNGLKRAVWWPEVPRWCSRQPYTGTAHRESSITGAEAKITKDIPQGRAAGQPSASVFIAVAGRRRSPPVEQVANWSTVAAGTILSTALLSFVIWGSSSDYNLDQPPIASQVYKTLMQYVMTAGIRYPLARYPNEHLVIFNRWFGYVIGLCRSLLWHRRD